MSKLLGQAADGKPGAVERFFELLLESEVYVGCRPGEQQEAVGVVGESKLDSSGYATVTYNGKLTLPIFTEQDFVATWAESDLPVEKKEFRTLLWLLSDDEWMYLNANQECGKELSPWEISQLRRGVEAIPELANELLEGTSEEIEVRNSPELYSELKRKLLPILETYRDVEEAFLVGIKRDGEETESPAIGLKHSGLHPEVLISLREEFEDAAEAYLPTGQDLIFVGDLSSRASTNSSLFRDATPFYIAQKPSQSRKGVFGRMAAKILPSKK